MIWKSVADLGETMKTASLCAHGGRAPYPVLTAIEHFGHEFRRRLSGVPEMNHQPKLMLDNGMLTDGIHASDHRWTHYSR